MSILRHLFKRAPNPAQGPAFGATHGGRKRSNNEDCYRLLPDRDLYIVSDGMGGHRAGEIASQTAVDTLDGYFSLGRISRMRADPQQIRREMTDALLEAHQTIVRMGEKKEEYFGMGCTVVVAFITEDFVYSCHVGDSRVYLINPSGITQITQDHSYVAQRVRAGKMTPEEARHSPLKNRLTQALGADLPIAPAYNVQPWSAEDKILLCSDGLWDMLSDEEIFAIVAAGESPEATCNRLIEEANEAGGDDNITVVLVQMTSSFAS